MSEEKDPKDKPQDEIRPYGAKQDGTLEVPAEFRTSEIEALVSEAQSGDSEALNSLFQHYYNRMVGQARLRLGCRLRTKEEADDLAQTTFREATRDFARYEYRGDGSLLRWLVQILRNKIRDRAEYYTAGKRDVSRERPVEELRASDSSGPGMRFESASEDLSVTRVVQRKEEFGILQDAFDRLSPDHRKAITLVFFQGMTLRQAGEEMEGRSEDAVRMLLRRAEGRLRELTQSRLS